MNIFVKQVPRPLVANYVHEIHSNIRKNIHTLTAIVSRDFKILTYEFF